MKSSNVVVFVEDMQMKAQAILKPIKLYYYDNVVETNELHITITNPNWSIDDSEKLEIIRKTLKEYWPINLTYTSGKMYIAPNVYSNFYRFTLLKAHNSELITAKRILGYFALTLE